MSIHPAISELQTKIDKLNLNTKAEPHLLACSKTEKQIHIDFFCDPREDIFHEFLSAICDENISNKLATLLCLDKSLCHISTQIRIV